MVAWRHPLVRHDSSAASPDEHTTMRQPTIEVISTDILILGSGGAGLFAALHAFEANPRAAILICVKGLLGKSGCTRMVQGGYNAVLHPSDSLDQHFHDTIEGGAYLNDQELAWTLIATTPEHIRERYSAASPGIVWLPIMRGKIRRRSPTRRCRR
jgi:hypothetical protein